MLNEFARKQLHFIIQKYGQLIVDDARRCKGLLKDLAPKHQRETNLIMLVQEHKLISELLRESQIPVSIKLDRLSQKLHDNVGIQKDFALWAIESWAIALKILPSEYQDLVPDKHDDFYKDNIPERLFELGERFYNGYGVEKDGIEAFKYYKLAAEQGHIEAQYNMGEMYHWGQYVDTNYTEALKWYQLAAERGHIESQNNLGDLHYYGDGVPENEGEALKWYQLAADQGHAESQFCIGWIYSFSTDIEKNEGEVLKWYQLAAEQGHVEAKEELSAIYYEYGLQFQCPGVNKNTDEAILWYRLAAEQNHFPSQQLLFMLAERGYVEAQFNLGEMYFFGKGLEKNEQEAFKWYVLAAQLGHKEAKEKLSNLHYLNLNITYN
jgi:TPR repeat protein